MANNRLYLKHRPTGKEFLLAKTYLNGWYPWEDDIVPFYERLEKFFDEVKDDSGLDGHSETDFYVYDESEICRRKNDENN